MKRVESSKEASRNLVVIDPDGTTEWQEVTLDPPTWYVRNYHLLPFMPRTDIVALTDTHPPGPMNASSR